ncbi:hypothetical protein DSO57_1035028 [Entomophthora muscae]|uniref:Uncharacterized protein n=1 Tax=Entomophthora muscae TaxID=34485 RepID=A0ACC2S1W6_9FUNG|nr:hypothetical protein DSO57_1035028 [Entomophthora muscae]
MPGILEMLIFSTEVQAGIAAFLAQAYVIGLSASVIAESGGTCECLPPVGATGKALLCLEDAVYLACKASFKKDLATAVSVVTGLGSILMGAVSNLPIQVSVGMGTGVYFVYSMVGFHGSSGLKYPVALGAVFLEGLVFILLTLLGVRQWMGKVFPASLKHATTVGLGLFISFIGFRQSSGIGLVGPDPETLVALSGCTVFNQDPETHACLSGVMQDPVTWLGLAGLLLISLLLMFRVRGAMLIGILLVSFISWIRHTPVTYFPDTPEGDALFDYFKSIAGFHKIESILGIVKIDATHAQVWVAMLTMLYVDLLDATGTIFAQASLMDIIDSSGDFEGATMAFLCDGAAICIGAFLGVPPVTALLESGVGIAEGGRTGIVAIVTGLLFFLSVFLSPIFTSFPPWATGPAVIVIGALMTQSVTRIRWDYPGEAVPAFLTIILMPLTFSVAYGILAGIISYVALNSLSKLVTFISRGRFVAPLPPAEEDPESKDYSLSPPWLPALKALWRKRRGDPLE